MLTDLMMYGSGDGSIALHLLRVALTIPTPVVLSTRSPVISPATHSAVVTLSRIYFSCSYHYVANIICCFLV